MRYIDRKPLIILLIILSSLLLISLSVIVSTLTSSEPEYSPLTLQYVANYSLLDFFDEKSINDFFIDYEERFDIHLGVNNVWKSSADYYKITLFPMTDRDIDQVSVAIAVDGGTNYGDVVAKISFDCNGTLIVPLVLGSDIRNWEIESPYVITLDNNHERSPFDDHEPIDRESHQIVTMKTIDGTDAAIDLFTIDVSWCKNLENLTITGLKEDSVSLLVFGARVRFDR